MGTKRNQRIAAKAKRKAQTERDPEKRKKLLAKAKKHEEIARRSAVIDKREQEYAARVKTGRHILTRIATGGLIGGKEYQRSLAMLGGQKEKGITTKKAIAAIHLGKLGTNAIKSAAIRTNINKADYQEYIDQNKRQRKRRS